MQHPTYDGIKHEVNRLADVISAPPHLLPTYGVSEDFARPHIEIEGDTVHYVVVERGQELRRDSTKDRDELLYWIFKDVTFSMSVEFEVAHRVEEEDFRRLLFSHQAGLLELLSRGWTGRWISEKHDRLREVGLHVSDLLS